jgi:hypothetical protein
MENTSLGKEAGSVTVSIHCLFRRLRLKCPFTWNKYPSTGGCLFHVNLYNGNRAWRNMDAASMGVGALIRQSRLSGGQQDTICRDALASSVLGGKPFCRLTSLLSWLYCWSNL